MRRSNQKISRLAQKIVDTHRDEFGDGWIRSFKNCYETFGNLAQYLQGANLQSAPEIMGLDAEMQLQNALWAVVENTRDGVK